MPHKVIAIVPAAGLGKRFGEGKNKPFESLGGKPIMIWAVELLDKMSEVSEIIPVLKETDIGDATALFRRHGIRKIRRIAPGGRQRQDPPWSYRRPQLATHGIQPDYRPGLYPSAG